MQTKSKDIVTQFLQLERSLPPSLRPAFRAYALGYVTTTLTRLLTLLVARISQSRKQRKGKERERDGVFEAALKIVKGGLDLRRFATFCGALVGGKTLLEVLLRRVLKKVNGGLSYAAQNRISIYLSTFISAYYSLLIIQSKECPTSATTSSSSPSSTTTYGPPPNKTLPLTLFALTTALDTIIYTLWVNRKSRRLANGKWSSLDALVSTLTDPAIFAVSSGVIMWSWVYSPELLPRSYASWIARAAAVDERLVIALRKCRWGEVRYGWSSADSSTTTETEPPPPTPSPIGQEAPSLQTPATPKKISFSLPRVEETSSSIFAPKSSTDDATDLVLQSMCIDYDWPLAWGDPALAIPFPCEMVHMGAGPSCEYHALHRFVKSSLWAGTTIYIPINLLLALRNLRKPVRKQATAFLTSTARSSAFLGAFISLFYYGVCLARTRIGPTVIGTDVHARQRIDSGICVAAGCCLCGWSVLIEGASRRRELAGWVSSRALGVVVPQCYGEEGMWRERVVWAGSTALVFGGVEGKMVRGYIGRVMGWILER